MRRSPTECPIIVTSTAEHRGGYRLFLIIDRRPSGIESIRRGECEAALAGGVNLSLHPAKYLSYGSVGMHSRCRTFGEGGDGYVSGEGVGAVLLKPLEKAEQDGDRIYAVIKGSAVNHVGKVSGITVPSPAAQAEVITV